jgi:hypothetical protein
VSSGPSSGAAARGAAAAAGTGAGATCGAGGINWTFETVPSANSILEIWFRSIRRTAPSGIWIVAPVVGLSSRTVPVIRPPSTV